MTLLAAFPAFPATLDGQIALVAFKACMFLIAAFLVAGLGIWRKNLDPDGG